MRDYFASLGETAHPHSTDPRARTIKRFQELLLVSFREFSVITDDLILSERKRSRTKIILSHFHLCLVTATSEKFQQ